MTYQVKEIYYTLQGEGARVGRPSVFCRFSRCNLWSGREEDREKAICWFCDTDFVGTDGPGGGEYRDAKELADAIRATWPHSPNGVVPYVVFTGGEPLLQLDSVLIETVKGFGFEVALETNGTLEAPSGIDWITVSPKPKTTIAQLRGNELKLVYPHEVSPESVSHLKFDYFFLSPLVTEDENQNQAHTAQALEYCKAHPKWRLTMQYHKIWGIP